MTLELQSLALLGGLTLLMAAGIEIAPAMGIVAGLGMLFFVNQPLDYFARAAFDVMNSFTFTAIPLFVFMGTIYATTGIVRGLFQGAEKMFGNIPGSLASAMIVANAIFGAISGSSVAAAATFGRICFPEMQKAGYDAKMSLGAIAISGTLSVLIPPSLIMIVYGGWMDVSVARLFAGGVIPGIILTVFFVITVTILVLRKPELAPRTATKRYTLREKVSAIWDIFPFVIVISLVLGTTFGGIMTPTESASLGAFLSIVLALFFRQMTYKALKESMLLAVNVSAMMAFVLFTARMLGQVFQYIGLTEATATFMLGLDLGKYTMLALICILYLILGCFFDSLSMLVLTIPFVAPIIKNLGFDFIWFGVLYVVLAEIGLVTPPFGLNLFVLKGVVPKYEITTIFAGTIPFLIPTCIL
ncbi:MAG: TRAP transporter large permease, partial [Planctomycetaceae bacterium]